MKELDLVIKMLNQSLNLLDTVTVCGRKNLSNLANAIGLLESVTDTFEKIFTEELPEEPEDEDPINPQ